VVEGSAEDPDDDLVGLGCWERDGDGFEAFRWLDEDETCRLEKNGRCNAYGQYTLPGFPGCSSITIALGILTMADG